MQLLMPSRNRLMAAKMVAPEFIENVEFRGSRGQVFAYIDGKLLGRLTGIDGEISISLMGKKFRGMARPIHEYDSIADLARLLQNAHEGDNKDTTI